MKQVRELWASPRVERVVVDLRWNGGGDSQVFQPFIREIRKTRFKPHVLIGPGTFSSGVLNAWQLRKKTGATLVGEPTGGKPNCYGDVRLLKLPSSGIQVAYSTKYFRLVPEDTPSLMPDITIEPSFEDYVRGSDPVLDSLPGLRNISRGGVDSSDVIGGREEDLKPAQTR
jgi:C-terminal processing protease CtpA/Prc